MLAQTEQILQHVKRAKRVLLTCQKNAHTDSIASCLAVGDLLKKHGIATDIVVSCPEHQVKHLDFLPAFDTVRHSTEHLNHLVIRVPGAHTKAGQLRYEVKDDVLHIYLSPSKGAFDPADVKSELGHPTHDLIITLDTPDLNSLGALYQNHAEFFFQTPIINIDHNPGNEQYGQINVIDVTAVSTTEVIYQLLEAFGREHLDADLATTLLTGMISKTQSFKSASVTPRALQIASALVEKGARRDEIIQQLYRQHELEVLRLWGRVLARLQHDEASGLVWSLIKRDDFAKAGAGEDRLPGVIDDLILTSPKARVVVILYEKEDGKIGGWLKTPAHQDALKLTQAWQGEGSSILSNFTLPVTTLEEAEILIKAALAK